MRKKLNNSVRLQFYICVDLPELEITRQFVLLAIISAVLVFLGVGKKKGIEVFFYLFKNQSVQLELHFEISQKKHDVFDF